MIWLSLNLDFLIASPNCWRSLEVQLVQLKDSLRLQRLPFALAASKDITHIMSLDLTEPSADATARLLPG